MSSLPIPTHCDDNNIGTRGDLPGHDSIVDDIYSNNTYSLNKCPATVTTSHSLHKPRVTASHHHYKVKIVEETTPKHKNPRSTIPSYPTKESQCESSTLPTPPHHQLNTTRSSIDSKPSQRSHSSLDASIATVGPPVNDNVGHQCDEVNINDDFACNEATNVNNSNHSGNHQVKNILTLNNASESTMVDHHDSDDDDEFLSTIDHPNPPAIITQPQGPITPTTPLNHFATVNKNTYNKDSTSTLIIQNRSDYKHSISPHSTTPVHHPAHTINFSNHHPSSHKPHKVYNDPMSGYFSHLPDEFNPYNIQVDANLHSISISPMALGHYTTNIASYNQGLNGKRKNRMLSTMMKDFITEKRQRVEVKEGQGEKENHHTNSKISSDMSSLNGDDYYSSSVNPMESIDSSIPLSTRKNGTLQKSQLLSHNIDEVSLIFEHYPHQGNIIPLDCYYSSRLYGSNITEANSTRTNCEMRSINPTTSPTTTPTTSPTITNQITTQGFIPSIISPVLQYDLEQSERDYHANDIMTYVSKKYNKVVEQLRRNALIEYILQGLYDLDWNGELDRLYTYRIQPKVNNKMFYHLNRVSHFDRLESSLRNHHHIDNQSHYDEYGKLLKMNISTEETYRFHDMFEFENAMTTIIPISTRYYTIHNYLLQLDSETLGRPISNFDAMVSGLSPSAKVDAYQPITSRIPPQTQTATTTNHSILHSNKNQHTNNQASNQPSNDSNHIENVLSNMKTPQVFTNCLFFITGKTTVPLSILNLIISSCGGRLVMSVGLLGMYQQRNRDLITYIIGDQLSASRFEEMTEMQRKFTKRQNHWNNANFTQYRNVIDMIGRYNDNSDKKTGGGGITSHGYRFDGNNSTQNSSQLTHKASSYHRYQRNDMDTQDSDESDSNEDEISPRNDCRMSLRSNRSLLYQHRGDQQGHSYYPLPTQDDFNGATLPSQILINSMNDLSDGSNQNNKATARNDLVKFFLAQEKNEKDDGVNKNDNEKQHENDQKQLLQTNTSNAISNPPKVHLYKRTQPAQVRRSNGLNDKSQGDVQRQQSPPQPQKQQRQKPLLPANSLSPPISVDMKNKVFNQQPQVRQRQIYCIDDEDNDGILEATLVPASEKVNPTTNHRPKPLLDNKTNVIEKPSVGISRPIEAMFNKALMERKKRIGNNNIQQPICLDPTPVKRQKGNSNRRVSHSTDKGGYLDDYDDEEIYHLHFSEDNNKIITEALPPSVDEYVLHKGEDSDEFVECSHDASGVLNKMDHEIEIFIQQDNDFIDVTSKTNDDDDDVCIENRVDQDQNCISLITPITSIPTIPIHQDTMLTNSPQQQLDFPQQQEGKLDGEKELEEEQQQEDIIQTNNTNKPLQSLWWLNERWIIDCVLYGLHVAEEEYCYFYKK